MSDLIEYEIHAGDALETVHSTETDQQTVLDTWLREKDYRAKYSKGSDNPATIRVVDWEVKLERWEEKYKLFSNPNESDDINYFQPYGDDLMFLQALDPHHIWTVVDVEEGLAICPGWHIVNRVYYLVTLKPWPEEDDFGDLLWHRSESDLCEYNGCKQVWAEEITINVHGAELTKQVCEDHVDQDGKWTDGFEFKSV